MYTLVHVHFSDFGFGKIRGLLSETVYEWRLKYILYQLGSEIKRRHAFCKYLFHVTSKQQKSLLARCENGNLSCLNHEDMVNSALIAPNTGKFAQTMHASIYAVDFVHRCDS